ncbi:MAG: EF-P beta-lysylation protein EpmB [Planctomycetota bacterium]
MGILATENPVVRAAETAAESSSWQAELRASVRSGAELCRRLGLPESLAAGAGERQFPVFVPPAYLARIRPGDASDPLLLQVLPVASEAESAEGFSTDPVGDGPAELTPGVLQKYRGRALLVASGVCPVHCRYCFRRHFPYEESPVGGLGWSEALRAVERDPSITEVILSGGDPLMLADERLRDLVGQIESIEHVRRLRLHSRMPVVAPSRVTEALVDLLRGTRLSAAVVLHSNHARELDAGVALATERLRLTGAALLNQAVLLRGVNDSVDTLAALSERLFEIGVLPYYLHQLDRVAGAQHFEVSVSKGMELTAGLRRRLPGYLVPRYVRETAGEPSKTVLA